MEARGTRLISTPKILGRGVSRESIETRAIGDSLAHLSEVPDRAGNGHSAGRRGSSLGYPSLDTTANWLLAKEGKRMRH